MKYLTDNELFNVFLLCTIIGEFLLPCLLERYYTEYNGKTMVMSALGSSQSPVRLIYNLWLIWLGSFFTFTAFVYFEKTRVEFPVLSALLSLSIGIFAIGAGLISGFFSVNENKSIVTTVWDESKALEGEIGEYIVQARRSGNDWFVGAMNGLQARDIILNTADFLQKGKKYRVEIYNDDPSLQTRTKVSSTLVNIKAGKQLKLHLQASVYFP